MRASTRRTSARSERGVRLRQAGEGAALAVLGWAAADTLGIPQLAGIEEGGSLWLAALAGAGAGLLAPLRRLLWGGAALAVVLLLIVTATPVMRGPARALVRRDAPVPVDAVVALSGGATREGLVAGQGLERLLSALELARTHRVPLVVTVVRAEERGRGPTTLADQQRLAAVAGVPLVSLDSVFSTRDEAVRVAALARARGWRRVAVVTSPLHSRRGCAVFERAGLAVACAPAASREMSLGSLDGPGERLRAFRYWLYELVATAVYRGRGWI